MQRKYNMALQHFYQAATHSSAEDDSLKSRLNDLSGSEEELFSSEKSKAEIYELKEKKQNGKFSDYNENTYFSFNNNKKNKMTVKSVKPVSLCTLKGCGIFWLWCLFFLVGVLSMTYFLKVAISKIQPDNDIHVQKPIVYERYHENESDSGKSSSGIGGYYPCTNFSVKKLWHQTFDKFQTESAVRLVDVNNDGIDDIISGFVTSLDSAETDIRVRRKTCEDYYHNVFPCFGGAYAVDGKSGDILWTHYSMHDIFAVNCNGDIDEDGVADCLVAGRAGAFEAVSGKSGKLVWSFLDKSHRNEEMNLYTPQFINDLDYDGIFDVIQIHGGDPFAEPFSEVRLSAKFIFFSGKTGVVLKSIPMPDNSESYFSPVIYTAKNGSDIVVFGTGGETHEGSLYAIELSRLWNGKIDEAIKINKDTKGGKGYMNPPVLVDVNKDGIVDVISAGYADTIIAYDGETLRKLWTYTMAGTETYSIPGVGYYNDDDVVDFMIRLSSGPGFPVYYDSKVLVLDGRSGKPISATYKTSAPAHSSPLAVSMEGTGNDLFLFWSVDCTDHEHEGGWFEYVNGTNVHESSRADSCMARFNTKSFSQLFLTNRQMGFPGKEIYYSKDYSALEYSKRKRHVGTPDHGGVQRLIQTGAITTALGDDGVSLSNKFDVVFAMYYIAPSQVRAIRPEEKKCIDEFRKEAKAGFTKNKVDIVSNERSGIFDHGDTAINTCLKKRLNGTRLDNQESAMKKNFGKGKLILYRFQVSCKCDPGKQCARVLPKSEQGWTEYMGSLANGYFNDRPTTRFHFKKRS